MKTIEQARLDLERAQAEAQEAAARARTVMNDPCALAHEAGEAVREANRKALIATAASADLARALSAALRRETPVLAGLALVVVGFLFL